MIGRTIRSAKMNAITPAKLMPPDQSTAASGTLPTEQTKLKTAVTGPMKAPQMTCIRVDGVLAGTFFLVAADEDPQQRPHQPDHHDPTHVLGQRELPSDQHP